MAKFVMPLKTQHQLAKLLESVLTVNDDGTVEYHAGWSDKVVADTLSARTGLPIKAEVVGYRREEIFGPLRRAALATIDNRVARLEATVAQLCKELGVDCAKAEAAQ